MKFALALTLLAIAASCIVAQNITTWGNVASTRLVSQQNVVAPYQLLRVQNRNVSYKPFGGIAIRGIMYIDYQKTYSTAKITGGGINYRNATVNILSQRSYGINSTVRFYV